MDKIRPKGTTNLYSGWPPGGTAALREVAAAPLARDLLTDGEPTRAHRVPRHHQRVAQPARPWYDDQAVGLGIEYNEELMKGIAKNTGGNYYYIDTIDKIPRSSTRSEEHLRTVASNVGLTLTLADGVELTRVFAMRQRGHARRRGQDGLDDLPDLAAREALPVLMQLAVKPHPPAR